MVIQSRGDLQVHTVQIGVQRLAQGNSYGQEELKGVEILTLDFVDISFTN